MWQGQAIECDKIFKMRKTYVGPCCSFNFKRPTDEEFLYAYKTFVIILVI